MAGHKSVCMLAQSKSHQKAFDLPHQPGGTCLIYGAEKPYTGACVAREPWQPCQLAWRWHRQQGQHTVKVSPHLRTVFVSCVVCGANFLKLGSQAA